MAVPRIFVSSTCYDLKYIRENMSYFIKTLGYEPILSNEGSVFYNPKVHTQDACLSEIENCQIFVLIIGGRFGCKFKDKEISVTNAEYKQAVKLKKPVFTLVEEDVYNQQYLYNENKMNTKIDVENIIYPAVDSIKIFDFISEVSSYSINNAVVPFKDFADIESYLKKQWAGMMFTFLTKQNEQERLADTIHELTKINSKIELLSEQILKSVGTEESKITLKLYEIFMGYECIRDLAFWKIKVTPLDILKNETFDECLKSFGIKVNIEKKNSNSISSNYSLTEKHYNDDLNQYIGLRKNLINFIEENGMNLETYLEASADFA